MVNKTKFYKTKVALAVVLSLGLAACGDEEGSTSTSQSTADASQPGSVNQQASGSIQGVVLDTNGTPVVGATVTTAGMSATTDTSGSYKFDGVQVANVAGADDVTGHDAFVIVIQSPEGYASTATVNVTPNAQIDAANADTSGIPLTTFIDGFLAQADTAVIPKMESTVEGVLRSSTTGEAVANAKVALDFKALSTTLNNAGTNFTLSGETVYVMTDADGKFTFENVSNDSMFDLNVEGYDFVITAGNSQTTDDLAVTTAEQVTQWLGDISVVAHSTADSIAPFITSATGVFGQTTPVAPATTVYGMLNRGIDQTFTINFSEPVDAAAFNTSDVLVALSNASYLATDSITLAADGKSMTVVLSEALDEGDKISIFIPSADAMDVAGNLFSTTDNDVAAYDVDYDSSIVADSGKAGYIKVNLCIFIEPTTGGSGVATQVVDDEAGEDGGSSALADYSNAFVDSREDSGDSVVQQINGSDSAERLSVFRAIQGNDTTTDNFTAVGGETTITLTSAPVGILSYTVNGADVQVTSIAGNVLTVPALVAADNVIIEYVEANYVDTATRASIEFDGSAIATAANGASGSDGTTALSSSASASKLYFDFDGVSHGSQEKIVYSDDLGIETKSETITFTDQAKPTTVIQDDYDLHGYNNSGTYTATVTTSGQAQYGNGGETSHAGINDIPGNPTLYIQPRHLAQKGANGAAPVRGTEFDELVADMSNRLGSGESPAAAVGAESTLTRFAPNDPALSAPLYDADAFASWTVGQDIGVAFSEVIALATTAPTYTGTETLTGFAAENSVSEDVDGNTNVILANPSGVTEIEADLVLFTTSDVVDLANNDNGAILGFAGAVSDARGNVADTESNAQVVMLDAMPPMVTSALWNGTQLVVTFNEAITLSSTASNLTVYSPEDSTAGPGSVGVTTTNGTLSTDAKTLTVELSTAEASTISGLFADGNDNEFLYEDNSLSTGEENHAVLAWDGVNDTNGNDWDQFNNAIDGTYTNRYEVRAPRFLMVNGVGTFTYSVATTGYEDAAGTGTGVDADGAVTYTITFTHPIDLTSPADVAIDGTLTATALGSAIHGATAGGWSAPGGAGVGSGGVVSKLSWVSSAATDLPILNAIFDMEDVGAAAAVAPANPQVDAAFVTAAPAENEATGSIIISSDFRTITLNVQSAAGGIQFGNTDFLFNTVVDSSLINGAQTSAGRFNWQNTQ